MFILTVHDREGTELKDGDIVAVSGHNHGDNRFKFFAEVKWIPEKQVLTPFHTFTFHSFLKVDKVPDGAVPFKDDMADYKIWYICDSEVDTKARDYERYLIDWRDCERLIENHIFRIRKIDEPKQGSLF